MIPPDWTPPAQVRTDCAPRRSPGAATAILLDAARRHTGIPLTDADLDAHLSRDLHWDWVTTCLVLWEAAEKLRIADARRHISPPQVRSLRTLADLVACLGNAKAASEAAVDSAPPRLESDASRLSRDASSTMVEPGFPMPVEFIGGTPWEMGLQYGARQRPNIRRYIGHNLSRLGLEKLKAMPELQEAIADPSLYFGPSEVEEIKAMSEVAGISWDCVLGHNIGIYPDYVPGCSQFCVSARRNPEFGLVHGMNEDQPVSLVMREHLTRVMTVRRPAGLVPHVTVGIAGQVGGLNGVNAAGLIVSSTLLLDRPRRRGNEHGLIQPIIAKRLLEGATTIPEALDILKHCTRTGGWSVCLSHFPTDHVCYAEYDGRSMEVRDHLESLASTNHSLLHAPLVKFPPHTLSRLTRLNGLLNLESNRGVSPAWAKRILRDGYDLSRGRETRFPTMHTIRRVDNLGSMVVVPAAGELWVTAGPMAPDLANRYFRISLSELFGGVFSPESEAVGPK